MEFSSVILSDYPAWHFELYYFYPFCPFKKTDKQANILFCLFVFYCLNFSNVLIFTICVCVYVNAVACMPCHMCGSQKVTLRSPFSPPTQLGQCFFLFLPCCVFQASCLPQIPRQINVLSPPPLWVLGDGITDVAHCFFKNMDSETELRCQACSASTLAHCAISLALLISTFYISFFKSNKCHGCLQFCMYSMNWPCCPFSVFFSVGLFLQLYSSFVKWSHNSCIYFYSICCYFVYCIYYCHHYLKSFHIKILHLIFLHLMLLPYIYSSLNYPQDSSFGHIVSSPEHYDISQCWQTWCIKPLNWYQVPLITGLIFTQHSLLVWLAWWLSYTDPSPFPVCAVARHHLLFSCFPVVWCLPVFRCQFMYFWWNHPFMSSNILMLLHSGWPSPAFTLEYVHSERTIRW